MHHALRSSQFHDQFVDFANNLVREGDSSKRPYAVVLQNWYEPQHSIGLHADDETVGVTYMAMFTLCSAAT